MALNPRQERSLTTQTALMDAAEALIAERGLENVSIRAIVAKAGQKNESALQYHFKSFQGLIVAIHKRRSTETQARRAELYAKLLAETPEPDLRQLCLLMVQPSFDLACASVSFRRYVKAFGHELALSETSALALATTHGGGGESGQQLGLLLKGALPQLSMDAFRRRMETAVRLCSASMYHQARQKTAFRGAEADLFLHSLVDALVGLLSAPESKESRALARKLSSDQPSAS